MSEFNLVKIYLNERKIVGNMKNNGNDNKKHKQTDSGNGNGNGKI